MYIYNRKTYKSGKKSFLITCTICNQLIIKNIFDILFEKIFCCLVYLNDKDFCSQLLTCWIIFMKEVKPENFIQAWCLKSWLISRDWQWVSVGDKSFQIVNFLLLCIATFQNACIQIINIYTYISELIPGLCCLSWFPSWRLAASK